MRQPILCLAALAITIAAPAQTASPPPARLSQAATNQPPMPPIVLSPVNFFRQLLMMSPAERNKSLASRTPASRTVLLAKVREYLALDPDEREIRLRATELRWYLTPLLHTPPAERDPQLQSVPPELRELAQSRLTQWDLLPPPLQHEFLTNDKALHYFAQATPAPAANTRQQVVAEQFKRFFELTPAEEKQILGTLSDAERAQMEKTLDTFKGLPAQQRVQCIRNYAKFAGMSGTERAEFLKNAESWSKMSPEERQTWRDLVANVPLWPPIPDMPPIPPAPPKMTKTSMATN